MDEQVETIEQSEESRPEWSAVAPLWHTAVLVVVMLALSARQGMQGASEFGSMRRMATYGSAALMNVLVVGWILLGLRLRRVPLRRLLGEFCLTPRTMVRDLGVAVLFWLASMLVLGSCAAFWAQTEARLHPSAQQRLTQPSPEQLETLKKLKALAPSSNGERAAWVGLCLLVGFSEELIFRGYLQQQLLAITRGRTALAIAGSACVFGLCHAYQGVRGVVFIGVFGALFGVLALMRRSLRPGMMAHAGHDLLTGLALSLLKSHHLI